MGFCRGGYTWIKWDSVAEAIHGLNGILSWRLYMDYTRFCHGGYTWIIPDSVMDQEATQGYNRRRRQLMEPIQSSEGSLYRFL